MAEQQKTQNEDFSLVLGGPLYQLSLRSGLIRPPFGKLGWRIAVITAVTWLPLVPLTILGGRFVGGGGLPFVYDLEVHARLLLALPLMVLAEYVVFVRMRALTAQFVERQIITEATLPAFRTAISSAMRLRNSLAVEIVLLLLVLLVGPLVWRGTLGLRPNTWLETITSSGMNTTAAGRWYEFVCVPVFQFTLLRWYYRIFIWTRFLFQVSRLDLNLVPIHPDRRCGLAFLGDVSFSFAPVLTAHSCLLAGFIANRILHDGDVLPSYKLEIVGISLFLLALVIAPLCVFMPKLTEARHAGLRTYGRLASEYAVDFAGKWTHGPVSSEPFLGTADIQSLADLDGSFSIVREMKIVPFGHETIISCLTAIALPLAPLALTMFSLEELLARLVKVVL